MITTSKLSEDSTYHVERPVNGLWMRVTGDFGNYDTARKIADENAGRRVVMTRTTRFVCEEGIS